MLRSSTLVLLLATVVALSNATAYDGYKIFEVVPRTQEQADFLFELSKNEEFYDFFALKKMPNHVARVMVVPNEEENFLNALASMDLSHRVINENVGRTIEQEFQVNKLLRNLSPSDGKGRLSTDRYYSHGEINAYIDDLASRYPSRVFVKKVGRSYEGRDIKTITITNGDGRSGKNIIFMDGGFHAREWISPAAVLYTIDQLVENFAENADLLLDYDWMILPVVNPDGYEHTQTSTLARIWRKTRQPYKYLGQTCYGADPNRNFDFHWNEEGASSNPCSDTFAGPTAFSEPETMVVRDLMHSLKGRGVMYLTIHSYGNYLLYPWGWTSDLPDTWEDLDEVARAGGDAIYEATGTVYSVGSSTNVLYIAAGASDDYAFYAGFPISITMELPGGGVTGFDPPASSINGFVTETWIGIRAMAKKVVQKYPTVRVSFL
uniref:Putative carboxypeptidase b-like protein n=1 Tax=Haematobia irritans TaxID=7368 RepID=A0A1L8EGA8_HAEIR